MNDGDDLALGLWMMGFFGVVLLIWTIAALWANGVTWRREDD